MKIKILFVLVVSHHSQQVRGAQDQILADEGLRHSATTAGVHAALAGLWGIPQTFGTPPEAQLREVLAGSKINLYDYKLEKGAASDGGRVDLK